MQGLVKSVVSEISRLFYEAKAASELTVINMLEKKSKNKKPQNHENLKQLDCGLEASPKTGYTVAMAWEVA